MDPICAPVLPPAIVFRNQRQWVEKNSKPRAIPKPPKIDRGPMFSNSGRMEELATPLHKYIPPKDDPKHWLYISRHKLDAAVNYVATGRITELAEPRPPITAKFKSEEYKSTPPKRATSPATSDRLNQLATPRMPLKSVRAGKAKEGGATKKAVKFKASKRLESLAEPIMRTIEQNEFPYTVNPVAMQYFPSKRTRAMAKPPHVWTEEDLKEREEERLERKEAYDERRAEKLQREKTKVAARHVQERRGLGL